MAEHKPGGWRFDLEDIDGLVAGQMPGAELAMSLESPFERPAELDPRGWSKIRNQGQEGSCQGHSITAAGEMCYMAATQKFQPFSPDAAYYLTQQVDGINGDNGSTISGGMKVAKDVGFCPEEKMPYSDRYNPGDLPKDIKALCEPFKVHKYAVLKTYSDVVEWLGRGFGGVSWGITWTVSTDAQGFATWRPGGGGGHANALSGYGGPVDSDGLPEYLWDKNSWGTGWGLAGWCKFTRAMFERVAADRYTVIVGISDMEIVVPRKSWVEGNPWGGRHQPA